MVYFINTLVTGDPIDRHKPFGDLGIGTISVVVIGLTVLLLVGGFSLTIVYRFTDWLPGWFN